MAPQRALAGLLLSLLIAAAGCAPAPKTPLRAAVEPPESRALSAMTALLRESAAQGVECVNRGFIGTSLAWDAEVTQLNLKSRLGRTPTADEIRSELQSSIRAGWVGADGAAALPPAQQGALSAAVADAVTEPHPRLMPDLTQAAAAVGLKTSPPAEKCMIMLLSAPVISGDYVFVERSGATSGLLFALRQVDGEWRVIGTRTTWLS